MRPAAAPLAAPVVSVLLTVYNGQRYLAQAMESLLRQTFENFEVIVIDDGSTDDSPEMLRRYATRDPRVRLVSRANTGMTRALNEGLKLVRGEFVARMDADDVCRPERFARQVAYLREHPECVAVGSQVQMIDPEGLPICPKRDTGFTHEQIEGSLLDMGWPMVHPAVMLRTDALRAVGGYAEQYRTNQDHDLFLRLAERGKLANLPETLLDYRQHFQSVSFSKGIQQMETLSEILRATYARRNLPMPEHLKDIHPRQTRPEECHLEWFWSALKNGNTRTARKYAWANLRKAPFAKSSWKLVYHLLRGK